MSDALTDIARDQERALEFDRYIEAVLAFLQGQADTQAVIAAANRCDRVPNGYWGSQTTLADSVPNMLPNLITGEPKAWCSILHAVADDYTYKTKVYRQLRALSPWPQKEMRHVSFQRFARGLNQLLEPYLRKAGKAATFGGNPSGYFEYVVFFDDHSTLLEIAESAVCIRAEATSWKADRTVPYIRPTDCTLEYLKQRDSYFRAVLISDTARCQRNRHITAVLA